MDKNARLLQLIYALRRSSREYGSRFDYLAREDKHAIGVDEITAQEKLIEFIEEEYGSL